MVYLLRWAVSQISNHACWLDQLLMVITVPVLVHFTSSASVS